MLSSSLIVGANSSSNVFLPFYVARQANEAKCACVNSLEVLLSFVVAMSYFNIG